MTLEATFILLLTFTVILFLFYAGIYQYDKCVIKQNAYIAALRGSRAYAENADRTKNRYFILRRKETIITEMPDAGD